MADETRRVVMYVDDDESNLLLMRKLFARRRPGDRLLCVTSGDGAFDAVRREVIHLVLLDLNLPGLGGTQILQTLKAEHEMPVVMLTGDAEPGTGRRLRELGADDYIAKPFQVDELVALIDRLLDQYSGR